jgi:hypothetical protein
MALFVLSIDWGVVRNMENVIIQVQVYATRANNVTHNFRHLLGGLPGLYHSGAICIDCCFDKGIDTLNCLQLTLQAMSDHTAEGKCYRQTNIASDGSAVRVQDATKNFIFSTNQ